MFKTIKQRLIAIASIVCTMYMLFCFFLFPGTFVDQVILALLPFGMMFGCYLSVIVINWIFTGEET